MLGDLPMRERRGFLRNNGITFSKKNIHGKYTFPETTELNISKLIYSDEILNNFELFFVNIDEDFKKEERLYLGNSITGIIVIKNQERIEIFKRMCEHEGAELKFENYDNKLCKITCPWHGKKISPIAVIEDLIIKTKINDLTIEIMGRELIIKL
jgi:nitrite reductase/ring-hydroxylating ferredoxin subunit